MDSDDGGKQHEGLKRVGQMADVYKGGYVLVGTLMVLS